MNWTQAISTVLVCGGMSLFCIWYGYILIRGRHSDFSELMTRSYGRSSSPTEIVIQGVVLIVFGLLFLLPVIGVFIDAFS